MWTRVWSLRSGQPHIDSFGKDMIVKGAHSGCERRRLEVSIRRDETLDALMNTRLKLIQKKRGYRYSIDAILLAHFCKLKRGDRVIDLGTANAVIPMLVATQSLAAQVVGVEIQAELIDMARRNIAINNMEGKIDLLHRDVRDLPKFFDKASFDVVISNPPYRPVGTGRVNPDPQRALARHEILGSLKDMVQVASFLLRPRGRFYVIYPSSRTVDMLLILRESNLEPKRIQIVHSDAKEDAKLVLAEGVKDGRKELRVLKPLFVYGPDGRHTREMGRIYSMFQGSEAVTIHRNHKTRNAKSQ